MKDGYILINAYGQRLLYSLHWSGLSCGFVFSLQEVKHVLNNCYAWRDKPTLYQSARLEGGHVVTTGQPMDISLMKVSIE